MNIVKSALLACALLASTPLWADTAVGPGGARDPYEPINRATWSLNYDYLDHYALRPAVHAYVHWVPSPVRTGIGNVTSNINEANYFVNNLLIGRVGDSGASVFRFAVNSTVGLLGFFDVAHYMGVDQRPMSMSTVLGKAQMEQGAYIMVPLMGPTTMRGLLGTVIDGLYFPYSNLSLGTRIGIFAVDGFSKRARVINQESVIDNALDPYVSAKDFYLQYEENKVQKGAGKQAAPAGKHDSPDEALHQYMDEIDK